MCNPKCTAKVNGAPKLSNVCSMHWTFSFTSVTATSQVWPAMGNTQLLHIILHASQAHFSLSFN